MTVTLQVGLPGDHASPVCWQQVTQSLTLPYIWHARHILEWQSAICYVCSEDATLTVYSSAPGAGATTDSHAQLSKTYTVY